MERQVAQQEKQRRRYEHTTGHPGKSIASPLENDLPTLRAGHSFPGNRLRRRAMEGEAPSGANVSSNCAGFGSPDARGTTSHRNVTRGCNGHSWADKRKYEADQSRHHEAPENAKPQCTGNIIRGDFLHNGGVHRMFPNSFEVIVYFNNAKPRTPAPPRPGQPSKKTKYLGGIGNLSNRRSSSASYTKPLSRVDSDAREGTAGRVTLPFLAMAMPGWAGLCAVTAQRFLATPRLRGATRAKRHVCRQGHVCG